MDSFIKVSEDNIFINIDQQKSDIPKADIQDFCSKINSHNASIGVIGLGYSGLQFAVNLASVGFTVTGIDFNTEKTDKINRGESYIENVSSDTLKELVADDKLFAVHDMNVLPEQDIIIISDQIPSQHPMNRDLSFLMAVIENIIAGLEKPQLVIIDTALVPGTTRDVLFPLFADQHKQINKDFFLALSPERIDPGNTKVAFSLIPRVVAGMTHESRVLAATLMKTICRQVIEVSSPLVAETVKFLENSYRWVNMALVNEMMVMCNKMGISIWEVIQAVKSNPFEYFRHLPSPGVGYTSQYNQEPFELLWKKALANLKYDILGKAIEINTYVTQGFIIEKIADLLNEQKKCLNGANILIIGVANKKDLAEWNESPAVDIIKVLVEKKVNVYYHDPYIPHLPLGGSQLALNSIELKDDMLGWIDLCVILMDHSNVDFEKIAKSARFILDTKNATHQISAPKEHIKLL